MFHDLKNAYREMLKKATHIADSDGIHISFPVEEFSKFEQEYNLCFVEPEDDHLFRNWQDNYEEDDER